MFFFIGGIQPREITIDSNPGRCPSCGLHQARCIRVDHYISLFFIPLIPVKKGTPFIKCDRCGALSDPSAEAPLFTENSITGRKCAHCGRALGPDFKYCPFCGKAL